MAALFRISLILCISTLLALQCGCSEDARNANAASFSGIEKLCSDWNLKGHKKIICFICKGLDPSCFGSTTTKEPTTTGTTKPVTTSTPSTKAEGEEEG